MIAALMSLWTQFIFAQDSSANKKPEMADALRADGKIYVVIAVVLIILAGLFLYVANLDRKVSRLEQKG
jgi:CcmD family protein